MPTSDHTPSEAPAVRSSSSMSLWLEGPGPVKVETLDAGTAVLTIGAHPARLAIFFPDLQTLWTLLVEAERQAAHLATEPAVDTTVVGDTGGVS